jgi:serine/threonine protein kinase
MRDTNQQAEPTRLSQVSASLAESIPGIRVIRELGRGGMAVVLEGEDLGFSPPRRVAVKLMSSDLSADPEFRRRFQREASLVGEFRHDNIVHIYSGGEVGGAKYLVMEHLPGGTLAERLVKDPFPASRAIDTGMQLASALAYAHERDVIHRDVKPANVLFTGDGKAVLSDFGVAKVITLSASNLTRHAMVIGSTRYMSPEQERAEVVTDRTDVYAWGLVLFEMLTGCAPPPRERVLRHIKEGLEIQKQLANVSTAVALLICRCLLIDPHERPSARQCHAALSSVEIRRPRPSVSRASYIWLGGGAAAIAVAIGMFAYLRPSAPAMNAPAVRRDSPDVSATTPPAKPSLPQALQTQQTPAAAFPGPAAARRSAPLLQPSIKAPDRDQVTQCDRLAASPDDPQRRKDVQGVYSTSMNVAAASDACSEAMQHHPQVARFVFQAGRVASAAKDYVRARQLFEQAANLGSVAAMTDLGLLYRDGLGGDKDYILARTWIMKAADMGAPAGINALGLLYLKGQGVGLDYGRARDLFERAAQAGDTAGLTNLGNLYRTGNGVPVDYNKARDLFERAAQMGRSVAMRNLGLMYQNGLGVPVDRARARDWFERAIKAEGTVRDRNEAREALQRLDTPPQ